MERRGTSRLLVSIGVMVLAFAALLYLLIKGSVYIDYAESGPVMGTEFTVTVEASDAQTARQAIRQAFAAAGNLETVLSAHKADSELSALNDAPAGEPVTVSPELADAVRTALHYAALTDGAFDPTLGPCIRLWKRAASRKELPSAGDLQRALEASGYQKLHIDGNSITKTVPGMRIDLGGIGKGMAADLMVKVLNKAGVTSFSISTTSDFLAGQPPKGKIGWKTTFFPGGDRSSPKTIDLQRTAISSSGDSSQHVLIDGVFYSHVINPSTGLGMASERSGLSVTVKAPTATEADALSTACRVLPEERRKDMLRSFPNAKILD